MIELEQKIEKILSYKTYTDRKKVDALLEMDAHLYTTLGIESTKKERDEVKKASRKIYRAIAEINRLEGLQYLQYLKDV